MSKYLVYVKEFKQKQQLEHTLQEGKVYDAKDAGDLMEIECPTGTFLVHKEHQKGDKFDAEIIKITKDNASEFTYTTEDSERVINSIVRPIIEEAQKQHNEQQNTMMSTMGAHLSEMLIVDSEIVDTLSDVVGYIHHTYSDKYESEDIPAVDLYGLIRHSSHGKGFNVGQALAYLKRYMTDGYEKSNNPLDLYKAIHYLLFEITRVNNTRHE